MVGESQCFISSTTHCTILYPWHIQYYESLLAAIVSLLQSPKSQHPSNPSTWISDVIDKSLIHKS